MPLRPRDDKILVKERVFISALDYHALETEASATASVRRKLSRILFVYYDWLPSAPLGDLFVSDVALWEPSGELLGVFEADWNAVRRLVRQGRAHEISESLGSVLVAATKGPGGPPSRTQPNSTELARRRAWALKPALVRGILEEHRSGRRLGVEVKTTLESGVVSALRNSQVSASLMSRLKSACPPRARRIEPPASSSMPSQHGQEPRTPRYSTSASTFALSRPTTHSCPTSRCRSRHSATRSSSARTGRRASCCLASTGSSSCRSSEEGPGKRQCLHRSAGAQLGSTAV